MTKLRSFDQDTVDLAAWRERGSEPGLVERILDTNPGLADLGPVLPLGTVIAVPEPQVQMPRSPVKLWD